MNEYEQRQEERKARYLELAEKAVKASETASGRASGILSVIPAGQPILVGHHSERRHRRDLATVDRAMRKSVDLMNKSQLGDPAAVMSRLWNTRWRPSAANEGDDS